MAQTLDFDPPHMRSSLYQVQSSVVQPLCLLPPLSLATVLSEPQDDPLGPRCSSAAAVGHP